MELKKIFMEAAQQKAPKKSAEVLENTVLFKIFSRVDIVAMLLQEGVPGTSAAKIAKLSNAITIAELEETVERYPLLHKEQILRLFKNEAMVGPKVKIDSTAINRPHLISLVEMLEDYTGLKVTDDSQAPLRYLDERSRTLTVEDLAEFFAHCPSRIITIQALSEKLPPMSPRTKSYSRSFVKSYLADCCKDDIDESMPVTSLRPDIDGGDKPYLTVVFWLECRFNRQLNNAFLEKATVGELIDAIAGK